MFLGILILSVATLLFLVAALFLFMELKQFKRRLADAAREREALATELARAGDSSHEVLNSLPHAVAVLSPEGRIEFVNEAATKYFNLHVGNHAEGLPLPWLNPLIERVRTARTRVDPHNSGGGGGFESAIQIFHNSVEMFFLPHAIPLIDPAGQLAGITILLVDATQLRQIDEAKSSLLATVSHDLKTPLTSIQMSIHLLLEDAQSRFTKRDLELLEAAREDADRLHRLIQDILDKRRRQMKSQSPTESP